MPYILKPEDEIAQLFSDKTRVNIIELLTENELTNSQIARTLNLSKPTISHHIRLLLDAGIVQISRTEHEEHGIKMKFYKINPNILTIDAVEGNKLMEFISKEIKTVMAARMNGTGKEGNIAFLRLLKSTVLDTGIDMDKPFYDAGYNIGMNVISKYIKTETKTNVLNELTILWKKLGLGIMELSGENKIKVRDCYQCAHMPDIGKSLCPSDAGIIAGILNKTLKKEHAVKEIKCWGTGNDFCEFEIKEL